MKMKPSRYNLIFEADDHTYVYNTKTGVMGQTSMSPYDLEDTLSRSDDDSQQWQRLKAHGFLIEDHMDELREMADLEDKAQFDDYLKLTILPTEACNFRCVYCYEHFLRGEMSKETQDQLIEYVEKNLPHYSGLIISWFGGEPLEALSVVENLSKAFISICKAHRKPYNAGMTTNGYDLTARMMKRLKALHITEYQITLDGIPEIHDKQRILSTGEGTSKQIIDNLMDIQKNIKSSAIRIILRTNFSKEMMNHLDEFQSFIDDHFLEDQRIKFYWQLVGDYGYVKDTGVRDIFASNQDYETLMTSAALAYGDKFISHLYGPAGSVCYALKRNAFVIGSDGVIKKCTCDLEDEANRFGELGGFFDEEKHEAWLSRKITEFSACYLCIKRPICHNKACYKAMGCLPNLKHLENNLKLALNHRPMIQI